MQEHRRKDVGIGLDRRLHQLVGHQAVVEKQRGGLTGMGKLPEKHEDIAADQQDGEQGKMLRRVLVMKGYHAVFCSGWKGEYDRLWGDS